MMRICKIGMTSCLMFLANSIAFCAQAQTIKCPIPIKECIELCGKQHCGPVCAEYIQACRVHRQVDWDSFYKVWVEHNPEPKSSLPQEPVKKVK